ncbi:MAG: cystathionine gamma-synthase family protein [Acidovorax sp.]|uniref:cystathionine gamma-synthase family protein n=1 Tax=Acidovorax sp. TaxID=1872122 RepID=UPI00391BCE55
MTTPQNQSFTTQIVHADRLGGAEHGAIHKPIHTSVQYGYDRVEDLIAVFQGTAKGGFNYSRQGTPTTAALEAKITQMERGQGTIAFSTGMAGICAVFLTLLKAGDHLVASQFVFGNTNSVLGTLADLGIDVTMVDVTNAANVAAALRPNTRMVFVETIANPGTQIPDLEGIGALCKAHGALYVVDNTVASPYLFRAATVGAGLVVNSLTKSIGGHGDALGGSITDTGLFDWSNYPNIFAAYRKGDPKGWGLQQLRKKGLRDMGGTLSSHAAHQLALGAETLALRMDRTSATALALAQWLEAHPAVSRVLYPMLPSHPQHDQARKHLKAGSWLLSFELRDPDQCLPVCNRLQLPIKATGLADTRTLIIPVAHTIFWEAGPEVRATMGIADSMIRLSVGLEEVEDLLADFEQALATV